MTLPIGTASFGKSYHVISNWFNKLKDNNIKQNFTSCDWSAFHFVQSQHGKVKCFSCGEKL